MRKLLVALQFKKDLRKIPLPIKEQTDRVLALLRKNPLDKTLNVRKLTHIKPDVWRARIGSYRLVYSFDNVSLILHRIRHRKDIYRTL